MSKGIEEDGMLFGFRDAMLRHAVPMVAMASQTWQRACLFTASSQGFAASDR
jgi:hypothetical protein